MSYTLQDKVWELKLSRGERDVLFAMAKWASPDGTRCFPGIELLHTMTDISPRHIKRLLGSLKAKGLIEPIAYAKGGQGKATVYHIHLERGEKKTAPETGNMPPKGDTMSLYEGNTVTSETDYSDISDTITVTSEAHYSDMGVTPKVSKDYREELIEEFNGAVNTPAREAAAKQEPPRPDPDDQAFFELTDVRRQWAAENVPDVPLEAETKIFLIDTREAHYRDWDAAWKKSMLRKQGFIERDLQRRGQGTGRGQPPSSLMVGGANGSGSVPSNQGGHKDRRGGENGNGYSKEGRHDREARVFADLREEARSLVEAPDRHRALGPGTDTS